MAGKSSVGELPPEIRELIADLRTKQNCSIDVILEKLRDLQFEVSRSALGRHTQKLDKFAEMMKHSREMASVLVDRFGDMTDSRLPRLNIELMHSMMLKAVMLENGELQNLSPEDLMFLGRMIKDLATAAKADDDLRLKIEQRATERARSEAADAAETVAKEHGLTANTVQAIRQQILGVKAPAAKAE